MSLRAILSGAVGKAAEIRTSKNGNPFATLSIRENVNGATRWWPAIAFSESAIESLKELSVGEPIAVAGEITGEVYAQAGAESRINWRVTIDAVLSARKPPKAKPASTVRKRKEAALSAPEPRPGRSIASRSWASPEPVATSGVPFDDAIPF
jgi:single-stranded DNA-binding protein